MRLTSVDVSGYLKVGLNSFSVRLTGAMVQYPPLPAARARFSYLYIRSTLREDKRQVKLDGNFGITQAKRPAISRAFQKNCEENYFPTNGGTNTTPISHGCSIQVSCGMSIT